MTEHKEKRITMKRLFTAILVLVMVLGLCACGNKYAKYDSINQKLDAGDYEGAILEIMAMYEAQQGGNNGNNGGSNDGTKPTEPAKPTDEEWTVIWRYESIARSLMNYANSNSISYYDEETKTHHEGSAALAKYYQELLSMDAVDTWLESEYVRDRLSEDINCDRQAVLAGFSKLENVLLKYVVSKTDNLDNVSTFNAGIRMYNEQGQVVRITNSLDEIALFLSPDHRWAWGIPLNIAYSEDGKVSKLTTGYGDTVDSLGIPVYDDAGNIIAVDMKNNNGSWQDTYTYDDQGRVASYSRPYYSHMLDAERFRTYTYTYNEKGDLLQTVEKYYNGFNYEIITTYIYDEAGKLTGISWSETRSTSYQSHTSTQDSRVETVYDEQGRIIQFTYYPGDVTDSDGDVQTPSYVSKVIDVIYGDYYFYNP